mgnify:FL=1
MVHSAILSARPVEHCIVTDAQRDGIGVYRKESLTLDKRTEKTPYIIFGCDNHCMWTTSVFKSVVDPCKDNNEK